MSTPFPSQMTGAQIENALNKVNGLISAANNGKILCVDNGSLAAKSAIEIQGGTIDPISITSNGTYTHAALGGYSPITVNVPTGAVTESLTVTENGVYTPSAGIDGYDEVTVNVSGGVEIAKAVILAYYPSGSVCTCSKGSTSLQSDTSGKYMFCLPSSGTWTLTCGSVTSTVTVDEYTLENAYVGGFDALKARCKLTDYVRLSNAIGDKALTTSEGGRWAERTSNEYVLIIRCRNGNTDYGGYGFISKLDSIPNTHNNFGDVASGVPFTVSEKTLYLCKQEYMVSRNTGLNVTTDSIVETFGTDTYFGTDFVSYGTNATELNAIITEYANTID